MFSHNEDTVNSALLRGCTECTAHTPYCALIALQATPLSCCHIYLLALGPCRYEFMSEGIHLLD